MVSILKFFIIIFLKSQLVKFPLKLLPRFVGSQLNLDLETHLYLQPHRLESVNLLLFGRSTVDAVLKSICYYPYFHSVHYGLSSEEEQ